MGSKEEILAEIKRQKDTTVFIRSMADQGVSRRALEFAEAARNFRIIVDDPLKLRGPR